MDEVRKALAARVVSALGEYADKYDAFHDGAVTWDSGRGQYQSGLSSYYAGLGQYNAGRAEYDDGVRQYESGLAEYQDGLAKFDEKSAEYDAALAELEEGRASLEEARAELEDGEAQYADGLAAYEDGEQALSDAQEQLDAVGDCRWVVLSVEGNPGYLSADNTVDNVTDLGMTFALMFVLVGALVIYATAGRIIEEQRRLVGATKALGFFNREIFGKYLSFGVSGTVLGMLLGVAVGYFAIQRILLVQYGQFYVFGAGKSAFAAGMTAAVFAAGLGLSAVSVWIACSSLMRATATHLMQEKTPELKHKERSGRRTRSLYAKLIILNMRTDKRRVAVTIVSVAGCCALLVAGFTMRQGIVKSLDAQFEEISRYDMQIDFDPDASDTVQAELETLLTDAGTDWTLLYTSTQALGVDGKLNSATLFSGDLHELDRFYSRLDPKTGNALPTDTDGIWLHQSFAEKVGLSAGDTITAYDSSMNPYPIPVAGVFRMYIAHEMILSEDGYEKYFGEPPVKNTFLLRLNGADAQRLTETVRALDGVETITDIAETRQTYQAIASVLDLIALMLVFIAGLMAYFILLNLVSMYISQKKRELTIMRVNGFTIREVDRYVLLDLIFTTVLGIVLGLGAGSLLGYRVLRLMENPTNFYIHSVQWSAWILASVITFIYAVVIVMTALRKVKHFKLTDVA